MATTIIQTPDRPHAYRANITITYKNPIYKERMYITGWFLGIKTEYKNELISHDGVETIELCAICGLNLEDGKHLLKVDSYN